MKKYLARMESAFAHKDFPLWVLSSVGVLAMPSGWAPAVLLLFASSLFYGYLKRNPGTLKDPKVFKRPEVQRAALLGLTWFLWLMLLPMLATVIPYGNTGVPLLTSLILGPFLSYGTALLHALKSWPKGAIDSSNPAEAKKVENWAHASCAGFMTAFVASIIAIICFPMGIGNWISGWLLASGLDANLPDMREFIVKTIELWGNRAHPTIVVHAPPADQFRFLINSVVSLSLISAFWSKGLRLSAFLTIWLKKANGKISVNTFESFLSATRSEENAIELKNTRSFSRNVGASLTWLVSCYLALFLFFGFSGGPIGASISGWLNGSLAKANMSKIYPDGKIPSLQPLVQSKESVVAESQKNAANQPSRVGAYTPKRKKYERVTWYQSPESKQKYKRLRERKKVQEWIDINGVDAHPNLRIFLAAIIALYGTVPMAVTGAVFLPYFRRRKIILNKDGIFFPNVQHGFMGSKALRLWSELVGVDLKLPRSKNMKNGRLIIRFRDKSKIELHVSQVQERDLESFLSAIDELSPECVVADAVLELRQELRNKTGSRNANQELAALSGEQFQSTIFRTHEPGTYLPDGETRVVRLLASRPLSCVYLARSSNGKLAIAKQFYLAESGEETDAMRKCLQREYELLGKIDHPSIAKVLEVFQRDESTYLLLEHVYGTDLRTLVAEQGARSEAQVYDWALQICEIMTYLHAQDPPIIHRDLTPDNLVLTEDGRIRVIDFGAAQRFMEGITGTIIGKQCYVPPEQLQGHAGVRSDVYSFAGVLQYLLTGSDPVALSQSDPSSKADVSPELTELVKRCSEFDENLRPESFERIKELLIEARETPVKEAVKSLKELAASQDIKADDFGKMVEKVKADITESASAITGTETKKKNAPVGEHCMRPHDESAVCEPPAEPPKLTSSEEAPTVLNTSSEASEQPESDAEGVSVKIKELQELS